MSTPASLASSRSPPTDASSSALAVRDGAGQEIARGLANYASSEARLLCRKSSADFERLLGYTAEPEMIHRDNLVLARG